MNKQEAMEIYQEALKKDRFGKESWVDFCEQWMFVEIGNCSVDPDSSMGCGDFLSGKFWAQFGVLLIESLMDEMKAKTSIDWVEIFEESWFIESYEETISMIQAALNKMTVGDFLKYGELGEIHEKPKESEWH